MSLSQSILDIIAFVSSEEPIPTVGGERWEQFDSLDRAVWREACRLGLEGKLPQRDPRYEYIGKTNLPGVRTMDFLYPIVWKAWIKDMKEVRELIPATGEVVSPEQLAVTLADLERITLGRVKLKTLQNTKNKPKPIGKRGQIHLYLYADWVTQLASSREPLRVKTKLGRFSRSCV